MEDVLTNIPEAAAAPAAPASEALPPLGMRQLMAADIAVWTRMWCHDAAPTPAQRRRQALKVVWLQCGLRATLLYRLSHGLWKSHVPALPGMLARLNLTLHGLDIPPSVAAGPGLYIPHPVGTVVMAAWIGSNVSLISGITIGMRSEYAFPTLADNVFVGAGARILGGITVGEGACIGANAVVVKDVPAGATAVGVPAKLLGAPKASPASPRTDAWTL